MAKINITIPDELLVSVDEFSDKLCMTRSGFVAQSVRAYIDSMKFSNMLDELTGALKRLGTAGNDDPVTVAQIERLLACLTVLQHKDGLK